MAEKKLGCSFLIVFLLFLEQVPASYSLANYNLSDYPWLQVGTYAKYWSGPGGSPDFVLPNGSLMIALSGEAHAIANMSWIVTQRTGDKVYLTMNYTISGAESTENDAKYPGRLTSFNFSTSLSLMMDVQTRMAYVNGKPEGIIDLWSDPAPTVGQLVSVGTVFVDGQAYNVTSSIKEISDCSVRITFGGPIESQGRTYWCVKNYHLEDDSFGYPNTYRIGWLNVTGGQEIWNGVDITPAWEPLEPFGTFDYYTGLAIQNVFLDFPVNRTVCQIINNSPVGCSYLSFSTALGEYFRSSALILVLVSTNAPLVPSDAGTTYEIPWLPVASVTALAVVSLSLVYLYRRRGG
jgi:hypothetical protein